MSDFPGHETASIAPGLASDLSDLADVFSGLDSYEAWQSRHGDELHSRWLTARNLAYLTRTPGSLSGWSDLEQAPTDFRFESSSRGEPPDLREQLVCARTGLSTRVRFAFSLTRALVSPLETATVYMTEQVTDAYRWLREHCPGLVGSEYFTEDRRAELEAYMHCRGIGDDRVRFEDITDLSFAGESLDAVLSFDVLEHVPNYQRAVREFARVVRPGGHLILTAPFMQDKQDTLIRAGIDAQGEIIHYLEPEFHGDPVRAEGVLCFQTFGWDLLDCAREAGFSEAVYALPWDLSRGLIGNVWTLVARR